MKAIPPNKRTEKQWKRKHREYVAFCRKRPWKIDEIHIASFEEFQKSELHSCVVK